MTIPLSEASVAGTIFNVMRFALHDGPGIRTTVFVKGCPLVCAWCHNPESQDFQPDLMLNPSRCLHCRECLAVCPHHATLNLAGEPQQSPQCEGCGACVEACLADVRHLAGRGVTVAELVREIERDVVFFDDSGGGVTISGGEPLSQPDFVAALLAACRARGIHTTLDTCGYAPPEVCERVCAGADLVLYDLKVLDPVLHERYTGRSNQRVLANLQALAASGRPVVVRVPLIPGVNDAPGQLDELGRYLASRGLKRMSLLPYHRIGAGKWEQLGRCAPADEFEEPSPEAVDAAAARLRGHGLTVFIGGGL